MHYRLRFLFSLLIGLSSLSALAAEKTIDEFSEGMIHQEGFLDFFYQGDSGKVYLSIDRLNQPLLFQSSLPQGVGSNDIGLDRGQLGRTRLVRFERFGDKVLLKQLNTEFRVGTLNPAERASIDEAFADSVIAGLPIVAEQSGAVLVDYTDFLLSDIHNISDRLTARKQGTYKPDSKRSGVFMPRSKAFVDNTELEALVTFSGTKPGQYVRQVTPDPKSLSVHLHHSLIRLPDNGYTPRKFHPQSGFWKFAYQDYGVPIAADLEQRFIPRHRLKKKDPEANISEPVEPIVYYLDPGIPEPIRTALFEGAMWWNSAFSKIGYQDAFRVEVLPEGADPMDVRYNVIQWVHRATRGWSYGSSVIDPRTGEIIKGHVTLGSLRVRQDYLIALGLTSPFSEQNSQTASQQAMALARIRQLSAHEVGHTLGIAHNFAASLNNRASVMDYPHPLLTLQGGKVSLEQAYATGMGTWDDQVIAYGYQDYGTEEQEQQGLSDVVAGSRALGLKYLSDPDSRAASHATAYGHLWDNGKDPIAELKHLYSVRRAALQQFGLASLPEGAPLSELRDRLVPIYLLHRYQAEAVAKLLGGRHYEYETKGDHAEAKGVTNVTAERQLLALNTLLGALSDRYLSLPSDLHALLTPWAYGSSASRESFAGRTGVVFDAVAAAESSAAHTLSLLLHPQRLNRLSWQHQQDEKQPGVEMLLDRVWATTIRSKTKPVDPLIKHRVDYIALDYVVKLLSDKSMAPEVKGQVMNSLKVLHKGLSKNQRYQPAQTMTQYLDWYWQSGTWHGSVEVKPLPPGSPI